MKTPTSINAAPRVHSILLRAAAAAALAGVGLAAATEASAQTSANANSPITSTTPTWQAGPVDLTFGGFMALESVYRNKNEVADIGSSYNSAIPYPYQANDHISEFRESARQSRLALLAQGPAGDGMTAQGYFEADFLSAGTTSNSSESNSYTLRMRHFYGVLRSTNSGWYLLAGQTWSLATMTTTGTMDPRSEQIPLTIDAQYAVGFDWTRGAQLRLVKTFGKVASAGISFEEPQTAFTGATPATTIETNTGGSLLNSGANYSLDFAPDIIAKFAVNPGWGHYEIYGMARGFRDRYEPTAGSVAGTNNTTWGEGVGASVLLPITSVFSFQASGLTGSGIGRYGSAQLPDVTVEPNGTLATINESDVLLGLTVKPTPLLTLYGYAGEEGASSKWFTSGTTQYGYGNPNFNNSGCNLVTGSSTSCVANTHMVKQWIIGEWWKVYQGQIGNFQIGLQFSDTDRVAFRGIGGAPSTSINMGFISFRYYPYQR